MQNKESEIYYDIVINGYDWGPAADKLIIHNTKEFTLDQLKAEDFEVLLETQIYDWSTNPPVLKNGTGKRTVTKVYFCDEKGNPVAETKKSSLFALELTVHPSDPYCNPFLYGQDMMNHWQKTFKHTITNSKLNIFTDTENKRIMPLADQFSKSKFSAGSIPLTYAAWKPENHSNKMPLIIWLHGMGEGGTDPDIALLGNKVVNLISPSVQNCFENGAYVLVPQVDGFWMQTKQNSKEFETWVGDNNPVAKSCYTEALFNLIDTYVKENPEIDRKRIYIGGCSNGGYMTINMLLEYPNYFAAAYPVCQAYPDSKIDENKLKLLTEQKIWFTQSKDDKTVNPDIYTLPTYKRLVNAKTKNVHLSLWEHVTDTTGNYKDQDKKTYTYNGHFSWIYVLNNECKENNTSIFQWISKQEN